MRLFQFEEVEIITNRYPSKKVNFLDAAAALNPSLLVGITDCRKAEMLGGELSWPRFELTREAIACGLWI